jgi:hypothetical protein
MECINVYTYYIIKCDIVLELSETYYLHQMVDLKNVNNLQCYNPYTIYKWTQKNHNLLWNGDIFFPKFMNVIINSK